MKEDERKPITPTLRNMKVNDVERWPFECRSSVFAMTARIRLESKRSIKFKTKTDKDLKFVEVQRIA